MTRVFVVDADRQPLMPCSRARARQLRAAGKARILRHSPFTIQLLHRRGGDVQPIELRLDPGSKTTGLALVAEAERGDQVVWAAELTHRGVAIKKALDQRRGVRRSRRSRHCRYRPARFDNRRRPAGWLAPSINSRVENCETWTKRVCRWVPLSSIAVETVRFDTQLLQNPDISGLEYQRGELFGCELREYLLQRDGHRCVFCEGLTGDPILEADHFKPRAREGSDRVSNLNIACHTCNQEKDNWLPQEWQAQLKRSRSKLSQTRAKNVDRLLAGQQASLRDAAAVNSTRIELGRRLKATGLPTSFWSGGRTRFNRTAQGYKKTHWLDAACVGDRGDAVYVPSTLRALRVKATGHGTRQMCRVDKHGFPRTSPKGAKRVHGFQTGDHVVAVVPSGKKAGQHRGRVAVRARGYFNIQTGAGLVSDVSYKYCRMIQRSDGYVYNNE